MRRFSLLSAFAIGLAASACGSSGDSVGDPDLSGFLTNGTFKATIAGTSWSPIGTVVVSRVAGSLSLLASSTTYAMTMVVLNAAPGTYSLNASPSNGSHASVSSVGQSGWNTGNTGGTGSVVIATLTSNHAVGTFTFDAPASGTSTPATLHVTGGVFDITY